MRIRAVVGSGVLLLAVTVRAGAEPVTPPGERELGPYHRRFSADHKDEERPDYVRAPVPSRHHHDGIYFRFAGGVGGGSDAADATSASFEADGLGTGKHYSASASSFAGATEVAFGYTLLHGLALGAGAYTATFTSPRASNTGIGDGKYTFDVSQLALFSPVVDWYVMPANGFHVEAGFGLATWVEGTGVPETYGPAAHAHTAVGTGFVIGTGYEWWVSDEWGLGLMARVLRCSTDGNDADGVAWSHTTTTYGLLLSATYN